MSHGEEKIAENGLSQNPIVTEVRTEGCVEDRQGM